MTGAIFNDAIGHAQFAAARAPNNFMGLLYGMLGATCSIAFELGSSHRSHTFKDVDMISTASIKAISSQKDHNTIEGLAVVIPAFVKTSEELKLLQSAIDAVATEATVVVVDDGSPISLQDMLSDCIVVRHEQNLGPAAARNAGTSLAMRLGASAIAFTDADCRPDLEWARAHASLQASNPGIWAGRTIAADSGVVHDFHNRVGTLMPRLRTPEARDALYAPTCNLSISREVAEAIQFDPSFPSSAFEDVDFCLRAQLVHNFKVKVSEKPVVRHFFEPGWIGLLRAYHKYGQSYPLLLQRHPDYPQALRRSIPLNALTPSPLHSLSAV